MFLFQSMSALSDPAVCRCVAELVARLRWGSVSLEAAPALLLAPLLLAVARRGVFVSVGPAADRAADGAVLPTRSLAAVQNGRGRPLLVLALDGTSEHRLHAQLARLGGALVYDVVSGAVYQTARYADVGSPVQPVGTCGRRGVELSAAIGEPSPAGWQDLRLVNRTIKFLGRESMSDANRSPVFSLHFAIEDMFKMLEEAMRFSLKNMSRPAVPFTQLLQGIKNESLEDENRLPYGLPYGLFARL